jgi:hypothetical protein
MPGTYDPRAQAKWQEKKEKFKVKKTKKGATHMSLSEIKREENLIAERTALRVKSLTDQKEDFKKKYLSNYIQKVNDAKVWGIRYANIRSVYFVYRYNWIVSTAYKPYYEQGSTLGQDEYLKKLSEELRNELSSMEYTLTREILDAARIVNRTDFIKDELLMNVKKRQCIRNCRAIKEELVSVAWHPTKVWAWIKAGRVVGKLQNGELEHDYSVLNMMAGYDSD